MPANYIVDFKDELGIPVVFDLDQFSSAYESGGGLWLNMKSGACHRLKCTMNYFIEWLDGLREEEDGSITSKLMNSEEPVEFTLGGDRIKKDVSYFIVKAAIFRKHDGHWCTTEVIRIPDMDEDTPFHAVFPRACECLEFKRYNDLSDYVIVIRTLDGKHERVIPIEMEISNLHYTNKREEKNVSFHKTGDASLESVRCSCGGEIGKDKRCKLCGKTYEIEDLEQKKEASDESENRTDK